MKTRNQVKPRVWQSHLNRLWQDCQCIINDYTLVFYKNLILQECGKMGVSREMDSFDTSFGCLWLHG